MAKDPLSSPRQSEHRISAYTRPQMVLAVALNQVGEYPMIDDWPIERPHEYRCPFCGRHWDSRDTGSKHCPKCKYEGITLIYRPDLAWVPEQYYVEAEGKGSASKGNEERDAFLAERGWKGRAFSNSEIKKHLDKCIKTIKDDLALRRAGKTGGE